MVETLVNFLPLSSLTFRHSGEVMSMLFWGNVYGVGNAKSSPVSAVLTDIFMTTVDCVVGLVAGWGSESLILGSSDESGKTGQVHQHIQHVNGIIQHSNQMCFGDIRWVLDLVFWVFWMMNHLAWRSTNHFPKLQLQWHQVVLHCW